MPSSKDAFKYIGTLVSPDENFKSNARRLDANAMLMLLFLWCYCYCCMLMLEMETAIRTCNKSNNENACMSWQRAKTSLFFALKLPVRINFLNSLRMLDRYFGRNTIIYCTS